jgi:NDP-sugar pyrophosphorylase family protein
MSQPTNSVVILAAGRGERFVADGFTIPKPLIEFRGLNLIRHAIHVALALRRGDGRLIVVTTPSVADQIGARYGVDHVVPVTVTQRGPAASALLAMAHLKPGEPVTFMDCDNFYPVEDRAWTEEIPVGFDFITVAPVPKGLKRTDFCNVRCHGENQVFDIAEKRALGGDAQVATGVYGFRSAVAFHSRAMMELSRGDAREVPMSSVLPLVSLRAVPVQSWLPIGTPSQLMEANNARPESPTSNE